MTKLVEKTSSQSTPSVAFALSFIGGLIIVLGGLASFLGYFFGWSFYGGMMGGFPWMMGGFSYGYDLMLAFSLVGIIAGVLVIVGALMLNARPAERTMWGTVILIFSLTSFLGMGGFFVGALLGIVGGAFVISWRPPTKA